MQIMQCAFNAVTLSLCKMCKEGQRMSRHAVLIQRRRRTAHISHACLAPHWPHAYFIRDANRNPCTDLFLMSFVLLFYVLRLLHRKR